MNTLATRVHQARIKSGLGLEELAQAVRQRYPGVALTRQTLAMIESGAIANPKALTIAGISDVCGVTSDWILGRPQKKTGAR